MVVTCSRNVAVESIVQKLNALVGRHVCLSGPKERVGTIARSKLLETQVRGQYDERKLKLTVPKIATAMRKLCDKIEGKRKPI